MYSNHCCRDSQLDAGAAPAQNKTDGCDGLRLSGYDAHAFLTLDWVLVIVGQSKKNSLQNNVFDG